MRAYVCVYVFVWTDTNDIGYDVIAHKNPYIIGNGQSNEILIYKKTKINTSNQKSLPKLPDNKSLTPNIILSTRLDKEYQNKL